MSRRRHYQKIDIDVEPFLSIMAIVLKLISLILVVIVMRIAVNPKGKKIVSIPGMREGRATEGEIKNPSYIDCTPDGAVIYPSDGKLITWEELQHPGNAIELLLDKVQANSDEEYIVLMVRPKSLKYYRTIRNMISKRPIDVGYDVMEANFLVDWDEATRGLAVSEN